MLADIASQVARFAETQDRERREGSDFYTGHCLHEFENCLLRRHNKYSHTCFTETLAHLSEKEQVLDLIRSTDEPITILDAGCGRGTDALLFAFLGADVVGVDINRRAIEFANRRADFYREKGGVPLSCRFTQGDVIQQVEEKQFDVVWIREAVSHIHPLEEFFEALAHNLKPGAWLIISEHNCSNPYTRLKTIKRLKRMGQSLGCILNYKDPDTGVVYAYAQERPFGPRNVHRILDDTGFQVEKIKGMGLLQKTILSNLALFSGLKKRAYQLLWNIEMHIGGLPGCRSLGRSMLVAARRK